MEDKILKLNTGRASAFADDIICATLGMIEGDHDSDLWTHFRNELLLSRKLDAFRSDIDFKDGVYLASTTVDYFIRLNGIAELVKQKDVFYNLATYYTRTATEGDDSDHKAVLKLLQCLDIVADSNGGPEYHEIQTLRRQLETIAYAMGMILEAIRQEQVST